MRALPITRRDALALAAAPWIARSATPTGAPASRVLRYAFPVAETGFDPAQISDEYSRIVTAHIFETMLRYDHLARPFKLRPNVAAAMPEISEDFRTFVFHLVPGIHFADDPAFKGRPRELVAEDFVYTLKRIYDPKLKSPVQPALEDQGIIGLRELRAAAKEHGKFDIDAPVEGLQALDRYTLRVKLRESRPRHLFTWAANDVYGAVAREVVEAHGDAITEHPVGTGPFRLVEWRRSSRIVLERNPRFREQFYDAEPNADDAPGQALARRFEGRRLPMVDRVEVAVIEESQPRWLAFASGEHNLLENLPNEYANIAIPGGRIAPNLARRGIQAYRTAGAEVTLVVFNMQDPHIGGYAPAQVALRRAIVLGDDIAREIRLARYGQAIPAQSIIQPSTIGYRADLRSEMGTHDPARAKALLDLYGYVDRDGDGWRERPDGSALVVTLNTQSDQKTRRLDELWKKNMDAIGLKVELKTAQWPENLKAVQSGTFTLWRVGLGAASPDGEQAMQLGDSRSIGSFDLARFELPAFDKAFDRLKFLPDGPERQAAFDEANKLLLAYVPYRASVHPILTDMAYPEVQGYRRPAFWEAWWQYVDIDTAAAASA